MPGNKKPRKRMPHRPQAANPVAMAKAMLMAHKIEPDKALELLQVADDAFERFEKGDAPAEQWKVLADVANIAEALAEIGICSDGRSKARIKRGQQALHRLHIQNQKLGTYATWADDEFDIRDMLEVYGMQVGLCDMKEYLRALQLVRRRVEGALAGAAPKGTLICNPAEASHV